MLGLLVAGRSLGTLVPLRPLLAFRTRFNRGERHSPPPLIDLHHPQLEHVAHADHLVRIADEAIGQAADVNQAAVGEPDIDERSEIDHVEHGALQFHAALQIFQLHDAAAEDRRRQLFAGRGRAASARTRCRRAAGG